MLQLYVAVPRKIGTFLILALMCAGLLARADGRNSPELLLPVQSCRACSVARARTVLAALRFRQLASRLASAAAETRQSAGRTRENPQGRHRAPGGARSRARLVGASANP